MKRLFILLLLLVPTSARAQSINEGVENIRVEVGRLQAERLLTHRETMRLAWALKEMSDAGADRNGVLLGWLKAVRIKNRQARERLKPLIDELAGWSRSQRSLERPNEDRRPMGLQMVCGRTCP